MIASRLLLSLFVFLPLSAIAAQNPCWPPNVGPPWVSQNRAIQDAIERLRSIGNSAGLTAIEQFQLAQVLKRLDEGMKFKTPKGSPAPRVVDGTLSFIGKKKDSPAGTSADTRTAYTPGWGPFQSILVNFGAFARLCDELKKDCVNTTDSERDEYLNTLLAVVLGHEGVHVDQRGAARQKPGPGNRECAAIMFQMALMAQIQWADPCLAGKWADEILLLMEYAEDNGCL